MPDDTPTISLADEIGMIRYDWPSIQLRWTSGESAADIAKDVTRDCPDRYFTARNTIAVRAARDEWGKQAEEAQKRVSGHSNAITGLAKSRFAPSISVIGTTANIALERKTSYIERLASWGDKATLVLDRQPVESMEDVQKQGLMFKPAHDILKDIHGLNAKEPVAAVQVNFLSDPGAAGMVIEDESTTETKHE